jgi:hypothetical protein
MVFRHTLPFRVGPETGGLPISSPLIFSAPSASLRLIDEISGIDGHDVARPSAAGKRHRGETLSS